MHLLASLAARAVSLRAAALSFLTFILIPLAIIFAMAPPARADSHQGPHEFQTLQVPPLDVTSNADSGPAHRWRGAQPIDDEIASQIARPPRMYLMTPAPDGQGGIVMPLRIGPHVMLADATGGATLAPVPIASTPTDRWAAVLESIISAVLAGLIGLATWAARTYAKNSAIATAVANLATNEKNRATLNEVARAGINLFLVKMKWTTADLAQKIDQEEHKNALLQFVGDYMLDKAPDAIAHFALDADEDGIPDFIQARLPHLQQPDGTPPPSVVYAPTTVNATGPATVKPAS